MRKHSLIPFLLLLLFPLSQRASDANNSPSYINKHKDIAIREMHRSGIPASITLAQAIHESAWGNGKLAIHSNNYFGIKCKDYWTGPTYYITDDDYENGKLIKSCFRAYDNVEKSFEDHSNFLIDNPRYQSLFTHAITDYRNWAKGLQQCGYATDKKYAEKLIRTIERYQLYQFDTISKPQEIAPVPFAAPRFNISDFVSSSSPAPFVEESTYNAEEENWNIPAAVTIPDDYQRGANRKVETPSLEVAPPKPTKPSTIIPENKEENTPPKNEKTNIDYSPAVPEVTMTPPATVPVQPIASPSPKQQESLIRMNYTGDYKAAQLNRKPRVSNNRRR